MNYKLTAITFPTYEEASEFACENVDKWVDVEVDGIKQSFEIFLAGTRWTVVFAKKVKRQVKEIRRTDCNKLIDSLGMDWYAIKIDGVYTLQHGRNGKTLKNAKARSWRGLLTVIRNVAHSYHVAAIHGNIIQWYREMGITQ